ncbi:ATP-binding protein [Thermococcus sp. SY098]|uniref:AAA family ATPase n=1 Tax=Thermococcus sp. SY098 TaxID=3111325 RepID=UPI002D78AF40|nr:ATP-binding protein [Thermococcus sp. SY098]WRS53592.1 ATP-binding protein [Thermococcus sp. SY098]
MVALYFDERPKERREDLYDREKELNELLDLLSQRKPLIVIKGIRRLGKTSLLRVALNESEFPFIIVDLRGVNPNSRKELYERIQHALNRYFQENRRLFEKMKEKLKLIDGVELFGMKISLSWRTPDTLYSLFSLLDNEGFVVAFDEVQEIRGPAGKELSHLIAHFYDYGSLCFILSGSEIGLLYDFIGVENPNAPLYGRMFYEIELTRFSRERSLDFLRKGFEQLDLYPDEHILELAVDKLDGIVGWLVKFGLLSWRKGISKEIVNEVLEEASRLAFSEFKRFLEKRPLAKRRYIVVMRSIASGKNTWSEIKEELEKAEKKHITDSTLARLLNALLDSSFIEKVVEGRNVYYKIADPVLKHAFVK